MKQTAKPTAQPKTMRFKPGECVPFELNERCEQMALEQTRDPNFVWKHALAERLALTAYLKAKTKHETSVFR